jgi:hypothetical protein
MTILLACGLTLALLGIFLQRHLWSRAVTQARIDGELAASADVDKLMNRVSEGVALLDEQVRVINSQVEVIQTQRTAIGELEHQNRTVESKLRNTQSHIASVCGQRDFWVEWYHRQVAEHGAAQSLFLQEMELHVKRGSKHPLSPQFRAIVEDFKETHPALAEAGQPVRPGAVPLAER